MPQKPTEQQSGVSIRDTWIPYVAICLVLIFTLGILFAPMAADHGVPAPITRVEAMASQLKAACLGYMAEYGALPSTSENYRLIKILKTDNPRSITFLNLKPSDLNANGELIDSWGTPYRITFDSDSKVHVVSAGPDKIFGTPDDVPDK